MSFMRLTDRDALQNSFGQMKGSRPLDLIGSETKEILKKGGSRYLQMNTMEISSKGSRLHL